MSDDSDEEFTFEDAPAPAKKKSKVKADPDPVPKQKKKKRKAEPDEVVSSSKKQKVTKQAGKKKSEKPRALKELQKTERLQYAMQSFLWWDAPEPPEGYQWVTMEHAGVSFPEPYEPHGVKMKYDGEPVTLTPLQEEAATFFASMDPDGMHLGNPKTAKIFTKNFFEDFRSVLGKKHVIKDFKKCDFEPIRSHLNEQKIIRKAITDEERKANKYVCRLLLQCDHNFSQSHQGRSQPSFVQVWLCHCRRSLGARRKLQHGAPRCLSWAR